MHGDNKLKIKLIIIFVLLTSLAYSQEKGTLGSVVVNSKTNTITVKGKEIKFFESSKKVVWRFVYNDKDDTLLTIPSYTGGITISPFDIVECSTLKEALDKINALGLKLTELQIDEISRLEEVK